MNGKLVPWAGLMVCLGAAGCGGASGELDPQSPSPAGQRSPATIVICPEGSSYDPQRNTCFATSAIGAPTPGQPRETATVVTANGEGISVRCSFANGWVSVLPEDAYPQDDSFLMQALIGLTEEPAFWSNEQQFEALAPYAARRCTAREQTFRVASGKYFILAGEADTFGSRNRYHNNGFRRLVTVSETSPVQLSIGPRDLTHTWLCISCPWVAFFDPSTGRYLPSFVILAHRAGIDRRGTDRLRIDRVPVHDGRIRLRVVEAEREQTHLDELVLEVDGRRLIPLRGGSHSALASSDGSEVVMPPGTQVLVEYEVPWMTQGHVSVELIATGHYEPIENGSAP